MKDHGHACNGQPCTCPTNLGSFDDAQPAPAVRDKLGLRDQAMFLLGGVAATTGWFIAEAFHSGALG